MADDARRAIENASPLLEQVKVEDARGQFWILKEDMKVFDSIDADEPAPVRLLPKFDSILLGHKDRRRIIQEEYKPRVFKPKVGDIAATVLVNGRIVGTWRQNRAKRKLTITVTSFERINKEDKNEMEQVALELGRHIGYAESQMIIAR